MSGDGTERPEGAAGRDEGEPGLEARLRRLEEIVSALEADELELDRALQLFEEGVTHVRRAEAILAETEMKVEELVGEGDAARTVEFEEDAG